MTIQAADISEYFSKLPEDRKEALEKIHKIFGEHIPEGLSADLSYGMPAFVVPHSIYPKGYHCKPEEPLPFVSYASQKNYIALCHGGVYSFPHIKNWFVNEYEKQTGKKPDMGKSCIRFKNPEKIPWDLLAELAEKITVKEWITQYEKSVKKQEN
jgi:uncharacterized protein YdhG (YjbR/CyaY superfamily)